MDKMPESVSQLHHREGIQNALDKAHDEAIRDNEAFNEANIRAEGVTHISNEEIQSHLSEKEKAMVAGEGKEISPELAETLVRLDKAGYLDTSFEGKETHLLIMRPLSREDAVDKYRKSGGVTDVAKEIVGRYPYIVPKNKSLDVIIMNFHRPVGSEEALAEMDTLEVRPLTCEELIQYGITYPGHQKQNLIVGLGTRSILEDGVLYSPILAMHENERRLDLLPLDNFIGSGWSFLVVLK